MESYGWIKINRDIRNWQWYRNPNTLRVYIHLLLRANYKTSSYQGIPLKAGQVLTGRKVLAKDLGLTEQKIRTALDYLRKDNKIVISRASKAVKSGSIITILEDQDKSASNWVRLERNIINEKWYKKEVQFCLYIELILNAVYKTSSYQGVPLKAGQVLTSRNVLSQSLGFSVRRVRTGLKALQNQFKIDQGNDQGNDQPQKVNGTLITICNYVSYEFDNNDSKEQITNKTTNKTTNKQPISNQKTTTNKKEKKEKNDKNLIKKRIKGQQPLLFAFNDSNNISDNFKDQHLTPSTTITAKRQNSEERKKPRKKRKTKAEIIKERKDDILEVIEFGKAVTGRGDVKSKELEYLLKSAKVKFIVNAFNFG